MLNFVLLDNNTKNLNNISTKLESIFMKYDFDCEIKLKTTNVEDVISFAKTNRIDVLISDITLNSDLNGFDVSKIVRKYNKNCYLIFETAHIEYSLIAYKYKTFDFICKPVSYVKLEDSITRLFTDILESPKEFIKIDNKNTLISENEIKYIKKDGMKLVFHTNNRDYEVYSSFSKIKNKLPDSFVRCHKSFVANVNNITEIEPKNNLVFFDNSCCDIGPKYKNSFMEVVSKYANFK